MATKADELRELPADELYARIESAKEELFNLRFQLATGQLDNPTMLKQVRHEIARIATVLREREIEEELDAIAAISEKKDEPKKDEPKKVEVEQ